MKKIVLMLCVIMSLFTTNVFAQEVRGIETRRATYAGEEYDLEYEDSDYRYIGGGSYSMIRKFGTSREYYGFEFTNLNSTPVSVAIEVYKKDNPDKIIDTKEIVLKSKEQYIHKYPTLKRYMNKDSHNNYVSSYKDSDAEKWKKCKDAGAEYANGYYVKYKAFKLQ